VTAGNAGAAYAWAGRELGIPITVVMAEAAVPSKIEASRGYGAEVILHGATAGEAFSEMERIRDERGLVQVHPFDDRDVIAGNGTIGLEIIEDLPDVDVLVGGVGGGGMLSGTAIAVKESRPAVRVYGVEPDTSNALQLAIEAGEPIPVEPGSVADGLAAPYAGTRTLAVAQRYWDDIVIVDDPTILGGLRFALERTKQVLEPAGSAALGAVLAGLVPIRDGESVCVVLSGGNVEVDRLGELLAAARPLI
jgi:threonine dehydratase